MPITIEPESGIPFPFDTNPEEIEQFRERAKAAVETIKEIIQLGGEIEITEDSRSTARSIATGNAPLKVNEKNAATLVHLEAILAEYDRDLLNVSSRMRSYVTNKLLIETIDDDPRVRIKALELLGKITSVGLFSENINVEVKHRKIEDIDSELNILLEKYLGVAEIVDDEDELDKLNKEKSLLDMDDKELGLEDAKSEKIRTPSTE